MILGGERLPELENFPRTTCSNAGVVASGPIAVVLATLGKAVRVAGGTPGPVVSTVSVFATIAMPEIRGPGPLAATRPGTRLVAPPPARSPGIFTMKFRTTSPDSAPGVTLQVIPVGRMWGGGDGRRLDGPLSEKIMTSGEGAPGVPELRVMGAATVTPTCVRRNPRRCNSIRAAFVVCVAMTVAPDADAAALNIAVTTA